MRAMEPGVTRDASEAAIGKSATIREGALHTHAAKRGAILAGMLASIRSSLLHSADGADGRASAVNQLEAFFRAYIRLVEAHREIPRLLRSNEMLQSPLRLLARIDYEGFFEWVRQVIVEGVRTGRIRNDLDPRLLALMLAGMLEALTTRWLLSDYAGVLEGPAKVAWEGFRILIAPRAGSSGRADAGTPPVVQ